MSTKYPSSNQKLIITFQCITLVILYIYFLLHLRIANIGTSFILLILIFVWNRWRFVLATLPFTIVIFTYEFLRNSIQKLSPNQIHITDLINFEQKLFGTPIPTIRLQNWATTYSNPQIITVIAAIFYTSFYWIPAVIGIILWETNRKYFWQFMIGLILLSYLGFTIYFLFPAAPPWWADYYGYLELPSPKILDAKQILKFSINHVAAMPSLHAAYPTYFAIMIMKFFGKKTFPILLLPIAISISAVYLSHHYIIDIIAGVALAIFVALILKYIHPKNILKSFSANKHVSLNQE